jgi:hypothetical protein
VGPSPARVKTSCRPAVMRSSRASRSTTLTSKSSATRGRELVDGQPPQRLELIVHPRSVTRRPEHAPLLHCPPPRAQAVDVDDPAMTPPMACEAQRRQGAPEGNGVPTSIPLRCAA